MTSRATKQKRATVSLITENVVARAQQIMDFYSFCFRKLTSKDGFNENGFIKATKVDPLQGMETKGKTDIIVLKNYYRMPVVLFTAGKRSPADAYYLIELPESERNKMGEDALVAISISPPHSWELHYDRPAEAIKAFLSGLFDRGLALIEQILLHDRATAQDLGAALDSLTRSVGLDPGSPEQFEAVRMTNRIAGRAIDELEKGNWERPDPHYVRTAVRAIDMAAAQLFNNNFKKSNAFRSHGSHLLYFPSDRINTRRHAVNLARRLRQTIARFPAETRSQRYVAEAYDWASDIIKTYNPVQVIVAWRDPADWTGSPCSSHKWLSVGHAYPDILLKMGAPTNEDLRNLGVMLAKEVAPFAAGINNDPETACALIAPVIGHCSNEDVDKFLRLLHEIYKREKGGGVAADCAAAIIEENAPLVLPKNARFGTISVGQPNRPKSCLLSVTRDDCRVT